jgi:hypothetical protein
MSNIQNTHETIDSVISEQFSGLQSRHNDTLIEAQKQLRKKDKRIAYLETAIKNL